MPNLVKNALDILKAAILTKHKLQVCDGVNKIKYQCRYADFVL